MLFFFNRPFAGPSGSRRVTRNSSHFKKLFTDVPVEPLSKAIGQDVRGHVTDSSLLPTPTDEVVSDHGANADTMEIAPRRSSRISVAPRRFHRRNLTYMK